MRERLAQATTAPQDAKSEPPKPDVAKIDLPHSWPSLRSIGHAAT
jgi:hypothetical protein